MNATIHCPSRRPRWQAFLASISIAVALQAGQALAAPADLLPVELGSAADFVILTKTGITNVPTSDITGDLGTSPIAATAITGFSLVLDPTNRFSRSSQVTGKIYAADYAVPTPANLTAAIGDMETAYTDAAGRSLPDFTELYGGNLSGRTLAPGLYKWSTGVSVTTNVTLAGASDAVWIFQISKNLTFGSGAEVLLLGGANARNIFWQVGGGTGVVIGTTAHVEGNVLTAKGIHLRTGASLNGRALAQTAVTLAKNKVVIPAAQLCGDYNGDGLVTVADALHVLQVAVGVGTCSLSVCDFNGDGDVTAADALAILRFSVGQPIPANCPGAGSMAAFQSLTTTASAGTTSTTQADAVD